MAVDLEALDECRETLEANIEVDTRSGLYDENEITEEIEAVITGILGEPSPELLEEYAAKARDLLARQAAEESAWVERTVNDRLEDALRDLARRGILSGQALGMTIQEGAALVDEACIACDAEVRGSLFYHRQDLERGVSGEGLLLAFGLPPPTEDLPENDAADAERDRRKSAWREVGREIVHVLRHHGIDVAWDGSINSRIAIAPFEWRRRRVTTAPGSAAPGAPPLPSAPT